MSILKIKTIGKGWKQALSEKINRIYASIANINKPKTSKKKILNNYLNKEQATKLLNELPPHLKKIVVLALATGMRPSTVIKLRWEDINVKERIVLNNSSCSIVDRPILCLLNHEAIKLLISLRNKKTGYVFTYKGKSIKNLNSTTFRKALDRAGIRPYFPHIHCDSNTKKQYPSKRLEQYTNPEFRIHDLRHTWASWHIQAGMPPETLKKLGYLKSSQMIDRYSHLKPS